MINNIIPEITQMKYFNLPSGDYNNHIEMLRLSTGDELNNLPMPTVEVEVYHVYHVWWDFVTDTFPPLSLLTYSHHGGILSWWEYAGNPI